MKIPTQNDFINNREQAFTDLYNYIQRVFYNKDEDSVSKLILKFLEENFLESFFEEYGEIKDNEVKFKNICERYLRNKRKRKKEEENNEEYDPNDIDENYGEEDEFEIGQEDKIEIEQEENTCKYKILDNLIEHIQLLPEREQARFKVAYLSIRNTLDIGGKQSPSDMPVKVRKKIKEISGSGKMSYSEKRYQIMDILYPHGFWQKYEETIGLTLISKDQKEQKDMYKALFRKAKFSNTTRDKEKMASIVDKVSFSDIPLEFQEKIKKSIAEDIKNPEVRIRKSLKPIPPEAYTPREKAVIGLRNIHCKEYTEIIPLFIKAKIENKPLPREILQDYLEHRKHCKYCKEDEKDLEKRMPYRIERLKEAMAKLKTSHYKFHIPSEEKLTLTQNRDLIRHYKYAVKHNPSDLNMMYLLLSYKQAGLNEEAKQLLSEIKNIKEYDIVNRTNLATQIKGE